jgi:NTE family protein
VKVGLVLGAGGVLGASWLIGALDALEAETGWKARDAEYIVGTSAGSVIGALAASGIDAAYMGAYSSGASLDGYADAEARAESVVARVTGSEYRLHRAFPPIGPGSWRLAISTLLRPMRHAPSVLIAGWLPRGFISTDAIAGLVGSFVPDSWPDHPAYWAVAADYSTGRRVAFGREDAPPVPVSEAVAASCAIPGFYHPVRIGGRRYVDGGICSPSNLDLLRGRGLDLVICLNPMSSVAQVTGGSPADRCAALMRASIGRRLGHEAFKLRSEGTEVVVLQPRQEDCELMGLNLMSGGRRLEVLEQARRTIARDLRIIRDRGARLPKRSGARRSVRRARAA